MNHRAADDRGENSAVEQTTGIGFTDHKRIDVDDGDVGPVTLSKDSSVRKLEERSRHGCHLFNGFFETEHIPLSADIASSGYQPPGG